MADDVAAPNRVNLDGNVDIERYDDNEDDPDEDRHAKKEE
jgi:hypothetical protein